MRGSGNVWFTEGRSVAPAPLNILGRLGINGGFGFDARHTQGYRGAGCPLRTRPGGGALAEDRRPVGRGSGPGVAVRQARRQDRRRPRRRGANSRAAPMRLVGAMGTTGALVATRDVAAFVAAVVGDAASCKALHEVSGANRPSTLAGAHTPGGAVVDAGAACIIALRAAVDALGAEGAIEAREDAKQLCDAAGMEAGLAGETERRQLRRPPLGAQARKVRGLRSRRQRWGLHCMRPRCPSCFHNCRRNARYASALGQHRGTESEVL
eukprot:6205172-Pleurochrysis_carterae.AAC.2